MTYASVVLDISTRGLDKPFSYTVGADLRDAVGVGCTVLVPLGNRQAVGYVVGVGEEPPEGVDLAKMKGVLQVLAERAFDSVGVELATWMASEYACNLPDALRLFLAPGQKVRVQKVEDGTWELVNERTGALDDRWATLTEQADGFEPRANARRQRMVLEALSAGPMRLSELRATMPGATEAIRSLQRRGVVSVVHRRHVRGSEGTSLSSATAPRPQELTQGQVRALAAIGRACADGRGDVVLVDGVTGSGKTEVYLEAIEGVLAKGKGALVLVPEIALTAQTVGRFRARFGDDVCVLHSRLSAGERFDQWDLVRQRAARVVVGARSALFAPLPDPGVIIIDEEHEGSYKQDKSPRYHAREVAAKLARLRGCALVLGSATPSLESLSRCAAREAGGASWTRVEMPERPGVSVLPQVQVVDMASQFRDGGRSIFSAPLADALRDVVRRKEKAVLLHNRRGFANFLMCRECGCVPECPHCSTSLTYHERTHLLCCHTCDRSWPISAWPDPSTRCPNCGSRYMAALGVGTQRVEDELALLLAGEEGGSEVVIIRMDADTTKKKGAHQQLLEEFDAAECAVLVGTQMIAKGLDFPQVTLVGVMNADTTLKLPDFRAPERTYALLEQVAGRAGRGRQGGRVIVQTYWATHPAIQAVLRHDRELFLASELAEREACGYPPYGRLTNVLVWGRNGSAVRAVSDELAARIRELARGESGWEVLGPADCIKSRLKDQVRRHIVVKTPLVEGVGQKINGCVRATNTPRGINVAIDVDAHDMM